MFAGRLVMAALLATGCTPVANADSQTATSPATAAVGTGSTPCMTPGAQTMARVELLFATARNDGRPITEDEWQAFVHDEVTPRFPDGLTEVSGRGQWRGPDGVTASSPSRILLIWYMRTAASEAHIEAIRSAYRQQFEQHSVMRVDGADCVSF